MDDDRILVSCVAGGLAYAQRGRAERYRRFNVLPPPEGQRLEAEGLYVQGDLDTGHAQHGAG